jgi:hypothetical protein
MTFGQVNITNMNYLIRIPLLIASASLILLVNCAKSECCKGFALQNDSTQFRSEKVSQTDSITLNGGVKKVFPLFGAFEERKWAKGWQPELIYMNADTMQEGTTFKTAGHGFGEPGYTWRINKYEPQNALVQYLVISPNRYWTITVKCRALAGNKTLAQINYTFIGLNEMGNHLDKHFLDKMYEHHLKDWEQAMNDFLRTGKPVND